MYSFDMYIVYVGKFFPLVVDPLKVDKLIIKGNSKGGNEKVTTGTTRDPKIPNMKYALISIIGPHCR